MFEFYSHETTGNLDVETIYLHWQKNCDEQNQLPPGIEEFDINIKSSNSPIGQFNAKNGNPEWIGNLLAEQGYSFRYTSRINDEVAFRYLSPGSSSGQAGVILFKSKKGIWCVY
ncbi:MAG: hypothetical protein GY820_20240, partial [Gammaproteobacteria bacterium]|nr:hypothetical protein [Gammaproteobacteria bacterium]